MAEADPPRGKMRFRRNAVSFPGNLHLVLVLRPTSFLQRTFTDIGLWFSHEDFMLKLPVVMLSSVSDLLTYIDAKQLTPELGGTLQYCHSEWILFTNAIEKFARSVKDVAYMLKSFGTELAETELPYDIPTIEDILLSRAARYRLLKNDITAITKEGTILLSNLRFPDTAVSASSAIERRQEISGDWQSINKLLTQVHDMETAFDGFWMKHKEKMDQYVQLWKFEQDFQEDLLSKARFLVLHGHKLAANHHFALDFIYQRSNEVRHLTDVMLKEMKTKRIQLNRTFKMHKLLQQAWQCCDEGESLLINGGKDRFQSEEDVQRALQDIENFLTVALPFIQYEGESLQREFDVVLSPELKMQMQAVQVKLENIRVIFERQQNMTGALTDKCGKPTQLQGSETEPLIQSITPSFSPKYGKKTYRPTQSNVKVEGIPQIEKKDSVSQSCTLATDNNLDILKNHVLNELIQTETLYVQELFSVLSGYRAEMENPDMFHFIPTPLRDKKDILFGNMPEIYEFHKNIFISSLENCRRFPELVGQCFLERKNDFLQMYAKYCQNKPRSEQLWKNYSECAFFQICQRKLKHRLSLDSYLLKPVQRITKYQLLLKELLKYTFDIRGSEPLRQALDTILELLKSVNDSMHQVAITGFMGNLSDLGKMILQGPFNVWLGHRRGSTKMKDFARFKPMQRHLFLYEKAIVFCKRRESGERSERYPSYTFKRYLQMENVGITEFVKGDARKFEICSGEKEEVYTLQPPNLEMKTIWLKEIQTILAKQQELLTVTVQKEETQVPNQDPFASQQKSNMYVT
ncbi:proto-oncogene DBL [Rhynchocyon petersi]